LHKNATKCNETQGKWCKNKHGASKIIDTIETYQQPHCKLGQSILVVLCAGSTLLLAPVVRPAKTSSQQPSEVVSFSYWSIKLWFHN
jgi:hypothetical protein